MNRSIAIIDRGGKVKVKVTVLPLSLEKSERLCIRSDGSPIYVKNSFGNHNFTISGCKCQITANKAYFKNNETGYYHEYEVVGTSPAKVQHAMEVVESLIEIQNFITTEEFLAIVGKSQSKKLTIKNRVSTSFQDLNLEIFIIISTICMMKKWRKINKKK